MPVSHNARILVSRCFSSFCHPAKIAIAILRRAGSLRISDGLLVIKAAVSEGEISGAFCTIIHEITAAARCSSVNVGTAILGPPRRSKALIDEGSYCTVRN